MMIDLEKSFGSYLYADNKYYLDLTSQYSTLPLGYNHEGFTNFKIKDAWLKYKLTSYGDTKEVSEAKNSFEYNKYNKDYSKFFYTVSGTLAVDAAIKLAFEHTKRRFVISNSNNFHGITGLAMFCSEHERRTQMVPEHPNFKRMQLEYNLDKLKSYMIDGIIAGVLIEPLQSTYGNKEIKYLKSLQAICNYFNVPFILDEVQTGFGGSGDFWYYKKLGLKAPDILVFGKKAQVSGIMTNYMFDRNLLRATYQPTITDYLRMKRILEIYEDYKILNNVKLRELDFKRKLKTNVFGPGLLLGMKTRDSEGLKNNLELRNLLVLLSGKETIKLRPSLSITKEEVYSAVEILNEERENITKKI